MNPDDKPKQCQVFGTPDFSDPTLYQRKSEVIGWLNQKWRNREYSDFQPPILPAAQMKMMGNDIMRYYMVEHCGVKAGISCIMGYGMGCLMGLFLYGGQADMAMAQGQLQPEYRGKNRKIILWNNAILIKRFPCGTSGYACKNAHTRKTVWYDRNDVCRNWMFIR